MKRPTAQAHEEVAAVLRPGDVAVDATAGNGHDTCFLAGRVGPAGRVVAFDIQPEALAATRQRLGEAGLADRVELFEESHAAMARRVAPGVGAVMFNLGYLPGGDHGLITRTQETLAALESAAGLLRSGGVLTVVCYPGHSGGDEEAAAVVGWARGRGGEVFPQARDGAPFLVVLRRACA